jgi:threonine/homoserine/homoserine lactone efflux protein
VNGVIGDILPLAVTVAISPLPIIAAILMLLSQRARANSVAFLLGWTLGVAVAATIFTLISALIDTGTGTAGPSVVVSVIKIVLGAVLIVTALLQWGRRPRGDAQPTMPKWMSAIDGITAPKAAGLGFVLSAVNPKNLIMAVSAGVAVGTSGLAVGLQVIAVAVFVVIAITTVAVPVVGYLVAADRIRAPLERLRGWLTANNSAIMSVLLLVIGVVSIGKGISGL